MRGNRSMFVGLSALVLAVGMLGANGYFQWVGGTGHTEPASRSSANGNASDWPLIKEPPAEMRDEALWDSLDEFGLDGAPARRYFPHRAEAFEIAQADGQDLPPAAPPQPPRLLPDAAVPIESAQPPDWLHQLIRQELPGASEVEQRIWAQELQGFEPEAARDILRMKKNVSAGPRGWAPNWQADPEPPPQPNFVPPPIEPLPRSDISIANRLGPSLAALELARSIILNNLANLHTVGFKRSRVVFSAMSSQTASETEPTFGAAPGVAVGLGMELGSTPLDMSPGPFKKTNHPLDVAIEGPGFFQIQGEAEMLFTRSGRFAIDAEGRLCLRLGEMLLPVQPAVTIPKHAGPVRISETGAVTGSEGVDAGILGQLQLARFQNPCDLQQQTGQVFAVSKASGPPALGTPQDPGFGSLRTGVLEQSNASRDEELEQFQAIQEHWHLLKHLAEMADLKPLTAPLTRRPANRTERVSADLPPLPPLPMNSLKSLRDQGRDLIEEYLQSERVKTIKRTLGLK